MVSTPEPIIPEVKESKSPKKIIIGTWDLVKPVSLDLGIPIMEMVISKCQVEFTEGGNIITTMGLNSMAGYSESTQSGKYTIDGNKILMGNSVGELTKDGFIVQSLTLMNKKIEIKLKKNE